MLYEHYCRMSILGILLLTSALCCSAAPTKEKDHCQKPEETDEVELQGDWNEETYPPGKVANYICRPGYQQDGSIRMACIEGMWLKLSGGQCTRRRCDQPELNNGKLYRRYNFPAQPRSYIYYTCNDGFGTQKKSTGEYSYCTATGWDPAPKCIKICNPRDATLVNANIYPTSHYVYIEGEKIIFYCSDNLLTPDGNDHGEITCLSDGTFSAAKCLGLKSLGITIAQCYEEVGLLLLFLSVGISIFSALEYAVEHSVPDTTFTSVPSAWWWATTSMTTVGYGDIRPDTTLGKIVAFLCILSGILVLALPIAIINDRFAACYFTLKMKEVALRQREALKKLMKNISTESDINVNLRDIYAKSVMEMLRLKTRERASTRSSGGDDFW